jgi:hypothetical protein
MKSVEHPARAVQDPAAGSNGIGSAAPCDPYQRLEELMQVIEELCPRWPARETFALSRGFLL